MKAQFQAKPVHGVVIVIFIIAFAGIFLFIATGPHCNAQNGFYCSAPLFPGPLNSNDTVNIDFGQLIAPNLYNVNIACGTSNLTAPLSTEFRSLGTLDEVHYITHTTYSNGKSTTTTTTTNTSYVSSLPCYNQTLVTGLKSGTIFKPYIWVTYLTSQPAPNTTSTPTPVLAASLVVKAS